MNKSVQLLLIFIMPMMLLAHEFETESTEESIVNTLHEDFVVNSIRLVENNMNQLLLDFTTHADQSLTIRLESDQSLFSSEKHMEFSVNGGVQNYQEIIPITMEDSSISMVRVYVKMQPDEDYLMITQQPVAKNTEIQVIDIQDQVDPATKETFDEVISLSGKLEYFDPLAQKMVPAAGFPVMLLGGDGFGGIDGDVGDILGVKLTDMDGNYNFETNQLDLNKWSHVSVTLPNQNEVYHLFEQEYIMNLIHIGLESNLIVNPGLYQEITAALIMPNHQVSYGLYTFNGVKIPLTNADYQHHQVDLEVTPRHGMIYRNVAVTYNLLKDIYKDRPGYYNEHFRGKTIKMVNTAWNSKYVFKPAFKAVDAKIKIHNDLFQNPAELNKLIYHMMGHFVQDMMITYTNAVVNNDGILGPKRYTERYTESFACFFELAAFMHGEAHYSVYTDPNDLAMLEIFPHKTAYAFESIYVPKNEKGTIFDIVFTLWDMYDDAGGVLYKQKPVYMHGDNDDISGSDPSDIEGKTITERIFEFYEFLGPLWMKKEEYFQSFKNFRKNDSDFAHSVDRIKTHHKNYNYNGAAHNGNLGDPYNYKPRPAQVGSVNILYDKNKDVKLVINGGDYFSKFNETKKLAYINQVQYPEEDYPFIHEYLNIPEKFNLYKKVNNEWEFVHEFPFQVSVDAEYNYPYEEGVYMMSSANVYGQPYIDGPAFTIYNEFIRIEGPDMMGADEQRTWHAQTFNVNPIAYEWYINFNGGDDFVLVGEEASLTSGAFFGNDFTIQLRITDTENVVWEAEKFVEVQTYPLSVEVIGSETSLINEQKEYQIEISGGQPPYVVTAGMRKEGQFWYGFTENVVNGTYKAGSDQNFFVRAHVEDWHGTQMNSNEFFVNVMPGNLGVQIEGPSEVMPNPASKWSSYIFGNIIEDEANHIKWMVREQGDILFQIVGSGSEFWYSPNQDFDLKLAAFDPIYNQWVESEILPVKVQGIIIQDNVLPNNIEYYPNPVEGDVVYIQSEYKINSIQVKTMQGYEVNTTAELDNNKATINVADLNAGLYLFYVEDAQGKMRTVKVVRE